MSISKQGGASTCSALIIILVSSQESLLHEDDIKLNIWYLNFNMSSLINLLLIWIEFLDLCNELHFYYHYHFWVLTNYSVFGLWAVLLYSLVIWIELCSTIPWFLCSFIWIWLIWAFFLYIVIRDVKVLELT